MCLNNLLTPYKLSEFYNQLWYLYLSSVQWMWDGRGSSNVASEQVLILHQIKQNMILRAISQQ